jgi:peptide/nickel transport system substrate-binding protein
VTYVAAANPETRANIAAAGDADIVFNLLPAAVARLQGGDMELRSVSIPRTLYIIMNLDRPQFRDKAVRHALSLALDREGMARTIMRDPSVAAPQVFAPSMPGWHIASGMSSRQDRDAARRELDAAGWTLGADGIRVKDGQRLSFDLISYASRPEIPVAAAVVQADLKAIGVDVAIKSSEWTIVPEAQKDGTLQAALMSRGYSLVADPIPLILADFARDRTEWGGDELEQRGVPRTRPGLSG